MTEPMLNLDDIRVDSLLERRSSKWSTYPNDVLAAWVAEMDFPVAEPIRAELAHMVESSDLGYPTPTDRPMRLLREAFAARMQTRFGWSVDPSRVEPLVDVVQGILIALQTLSEESDGVVVQSPIYPPFLHAVPDVNRRLVLSPLVQNGTGRYEIDLDALKAVTSSGVRVLLLCNPHNPTGRVFQRHELEAMATLAVERDWIIVSDEIHAEITYPGQRHIPVASLGPEVESRTVTLTSATKSFSIPGLRFAVAAFGSVALQHKFARFPAKLRGGVSSFGLQATLAAWRKADGWLEHVLRYLDANRQRVMQFAAEALPAGKHPVPEATYLAWLDCRSALPDRNPYKYFLEAGRVALGDGARFGPGGEGFVRLNFATSKAVLEQILGRLHDALRAHGAG